MGSELETAVQDDDLQQGQRLGNCPEHGTFVLRTLRVGSKLADTECPSCAAVKLDYSKREDVTKQRKSREVADAARKRQELEQRLKRSLIPERYRDYTLDTFPVPKGADERAMESYRVALAACRSYVNSYLERRRAGAGLIFVGNVGCGKTGLSCGIANAIMRQYPAVALFTTSRGVVRQITDTWGRRGKTEQEALDELVEPDILIVNDIGVTVGSEIDMHMLFEVIDERYSRRRPVILNSNLPIDDFKHPADKPGAPLRKGLRTTLGSRITSRVFDDGAQIITCTWGSLRGQPE